jgi:hypothetical protein
MLKKRIAKIDEELEAEGDKVVNKVKDEEGQKKEVEETPKF